MSLRARHAVPPQSPLPADCPRGEQLEPILQNRPKSQADHGGTERGEGGTAAGAGSQGSLSQGLPLQTDVPVPVPAEKGETFQQRGCDLSKNKNKK